MDLELFKECFHFPLFSVSHRGYVIELMCFHTRLIPREYNLCLAKGTYV